MTSVAVAVQDAVWNVFQKFVTMYGRRERNRASALEAYYRSKARRATLEVQLRALKEEDAALHALAAMAEQDIDTGGALNILLLNLNSLREMLRSRRRSPHYTRWPPWRSRTSTPEVT